MSDRYTLGKPAIRQIAGTVRAVRGWQSNSVPGLTPGSQAIPGIVYAKVTTHVADGQHTASQVVFDGTNWGVVTGGITWGVGAGEAGYLQEISGFTIADDGIVIAFTGGGDPDAGVFWYCMAGAESVDTDKYAAVTNGDYPGYLEDKIWLFTDGYTPATEEVQEDETPLGYITQKKDPGAAVDDYMYLLTFSLVQLNSYSSFDGSEYLLIAEDPGNSDDNRKATIADLASYIGSSAGITAKNSIEWDTDSSGTALQLVGDMVTPPNYTFYAYADSLSPRGWHYIQDFVVDTDTIRKVSATGNELDLAVAYEMSITSTSGGLRLSGDETSPGNSKVYGTDGAGAKGWYDATATTFVALTDTPAAYTSNAGALVRVNSTPDALEFTTLDAELKLIGSYNGAASQAIKNTSGTLSWVTFPTDTTYSAGTYLDLSGTTFNVDLTEVSGWNASNDQVLVNDGGTIKWVDLNTFSCP